MSSDKISNVILITLDAFRYDLALKSLDRLPNLRRLREECVDFANAFSTGPFTFTSFPGIISSIYPYYFGVGIPEGVDTIASILQGNGYNTAVINECNALLSPYYGYGKGIDFQEHFIDLSHDRKDRELEGVFLSDRKEEKLPGVGDRFGGVARAFAPRVPRLGKMIFGLLKFLPLYLTDNTNTLRERVKLHRSFRNAIQSFIRNGFNEPQFLWIHTISNHLPYLPPDTVAFTERETNYLNYRALSGFITTHIAKELRRLYVESLVTTDLLLGAILEYLDSEDFLDSSVLVITADHGEEFLEDGRYYGHNPESNSDRLLRVPLIFCSPSMEEGREISYPVSTLDILPTVLDILGMRVPSTLRGLSLKRFLFGEEERDAVSSLLDRPLYSEAWEADDSLDRSPGYMTGRNLFTVRKSSYKLYARIENDENLATEEYELTDWPSGERLDIEENIGVLTELSYLLRKHLYDDYEFCTNLKFQGEKEKIKKTLERILL